MNPSTSLHLLKNHDVADFRVRTSRDGWHWLVPSLRVRNAESGGLCRYCWPNDCRCF